jgi:putative hemolysin
MDMTLMMELAAIAILMGLSGFFSSAETALFSLDERRLEQMRRDSNPRTPLIRKMLSQPRRLIVTILIGNELVNVTASVISAAMIIKLMGAESKWMNLFIMIPLLLLVGEITPKTLAIRNSVRFASFQAPLINFFATLIMPIHWMVRIIADFFITLAVGKERMSGNILTEDMVRTLAVEAVGEGVLDNQEAEFIKLIFDFGDKTVDDISTPLSQIFVLTEDMTGAEMLNALRKTRHTKVPVFDAKEETVKGILFARDLLALNVVEYSDEQIKTTITDLIREPYFVPEGKSAASLFHTFRKRRGSIALSVDEYGGVTGLISMEDLLECIFGDIISSSDLVQQGKAKIVKLSDGRFKLDGKVDVEVFNEMTGASLPEEEAETVAGILLNAFGELPSKGSTISIVGWKFTILRVNNQRIAKIVASPKLAQLAKDANTGSDSNDNEGDS